jgi:hypothetical protein
VCVYEGCPKRKDTAIAVATPHIGFALIYRLGTRIQGIPSFPSVTVSFFASRQFSMTFYGKKEEKTRNRGIAQTLCCRFLEFARFSRL